MPSISQAKLKQLEDDAYRGRLAEERVRSFDEILDKIVRAANGQPLERNRDRDGMGYMGTHHGAYLEATGDQPRPSKSERHEREVRDLHDRIAMLEARLAAATAIATFARVHKA